MKNYVQAFQEKIAEIDADAHKVNIINAGVMNHGKSSLFNSLLDANVFPEEDIRTTIAIQAEHWDDNVFLIDTPGLSAEIIDDKVAYEAYKRANVILFVHRVDTGELHKKGLEGLNKIKSLFADDSFFIEHFCLVLTSIDDRSASDNLDVIREKALADIKNFCGISGFKVFYVSNTRYRKGMAEHKEGLVRLSGILGLRDYLRQNFSKWREENQKFRVLRIAHEKENFIAQLNQERENIQERIQSKTEQIQQRQKNFLHKLEEAVSFYNSDKSNYEYQDSVLENLNSEFASLMERWKRERY